MNKLKKFLSQINVKDIKPSTYVSAIVLIFTMVNYVLNIMGKPAININENEIGAWVTAIVGVVGIVYSWYHNQSISHPAQVADDVMNILKDGRITVAELDDFIARYQSMYDYVEAQKLKAQITTSPFYVNDNGIIKLYNFQTNELTIPDLESEGFFLAYFTFMNKTN